MSKVISGQRAKVFIDNQLVGLFESISYGENVGLEPAFILGRSSAAEITETGYDVIRVDCAGFRVLNQGVKVLPKFPKLQDLLNIPEITIAVTDRETGETLATILRCKPMSNQGGFQARTQSRISVSYMGIMMSDEAGDSSEAPGASDLP